MSRKAVTILSGGMDSATIAYYVKQLGYEQHFLTFNYGQRHSKEIQSATAIARRLDCEHHVVDLTGLTHLLKGSALTDNVEVPVGHYAEENMRQTVVPARNSIMLSIAWGAAWGEKAEMVCSGNHAGDHYIYEDCRPSFITALENALREGTHGEYPKQIFVPFICVDKAQLLKLGLRLWVPYELTWTCYKGGEKACGVCGSCCERLQAFSINGVEDPIDYEDRTSWKKFIAEFDAKRNK